MGIVSLLFFRVVWVTKNSSNPQVKWGTASGGYTHILDVGLSILQYDVKFLQVVKFLNVKNGISIGKMAVLVYIACRIEFQ